MKTVRQVLTAYRKLTQPTSVSNNPFRLVSHLSNPATSVEIARAWPDLKNEELVDLWHEAREAFLFKDADYGQWGLHLLSPDRSAIRTVEERRDRPGDLLEDDVVVGEFLGDQDLLVVDGSGAVYVAPPLDPRPEWFSVSPNLAAYLEQYLEASGAKFWEAAQSVDM